MKISIIHNLYKQNPYVNESVRYNVIALERANIDYQYILFNDKGDKEIFDDIKDLINDKVIYHYSDHNFGMGICSGGWLGALPLVEGDIIHNTGQDDVFTKEFYEKVKTAFEIPEIMFFSNNGIRTDENLKQQGPMITPDYRPNYMEPLDRFKEWFGVVNNEVTRAFNAMLAPGTVYRKKLHDTVGLPDLKTFKGACDHAYWGKILLFNNKGVYDPSPSWLYRESKYSTSNIAKKDDHLVFEDFNKILVTEFKKLWKEKMQ